MFIKRSKGKKLTKAQLRAKMGTKMILCRENCGRSKEVAGDVISWLCSYCLMAKIPCPCDQPKSSGRPRGWHFKKYFEFEGKVYSKGEEVTDKKIIASLKREAKKAERNKENDNPSA